LTLIYLTSNFKYWQSSGAKIFNGFKTMLDKEIAEKCDRICENMQYMCEYMQVFPYVA